MTKYIDRNLLEHIIWKQGGEAIAPQQALGQQLDQSLVQPEQESRKKDTYGLLPQQSSYALGVHALNEACRAEADPVHPQFVLPDGSMVYRPLTFKETIEAMVTDYENNKNTEERLRLFKRQNDSCTGIVYQAGTTKFKIVPLCTQLINIYKEFNGTAVSVQYDDFEIEELDRAAGKYNRWLQENEVMDHTGWRVALEGDLELLKTYKDILFVGEGRSQAMAFAVLEKPTEDQLRFLFAADIIKGFNAVGSLNLSYGGCFIHFVDNF